MVLVTISVAARLESVSRLLLPRANHTWEIPGNCTLLPPFDLRKMCNERILKTNTKTSVKLISITLNTDPLSGGKRQSRSSENTCSRAAFRLGCGDAQGAGEEADIVVRKVWCWGDSVPASSTRSSWSWSLIWRKKHRVPEEESCLLTERTHRRAGSQPGVAWC